MKGLIVYDSVFGNTEQIALEIGKALGNQDAVATARAGDVKPDQLVGLNILIVGSPTQRFRSTPTISNLLKRIPKKGLKGVKVTAFDTRLTPREIDETPVLPFFVKLFGQSAYAAKPLTDKLKERGGELIVPPEGFFVEGMKGPLVAGELERAADWAKHIIAAAL
jgi:flavodoxin I